MKNKLMPVFGILLLISVSMTVYAFERNGGEDAEYYGSEEQKRSQAEKEISVSQNSSPLDQGGKAGIQGIEAQEYCVFVCGEVRQEGVYYLNVGARVKDAIEKAGGFSEEADTCYWNLAETIHDAERIYVPSREETCKGMFSENGSYGPDGRLNLNLASASELMSLPGIGEKRANDIVAYRDKNGAFVSVEQLTEISGIKASLLNDIKDLIFVP